MPVQGVFFFLDVNECSYAEFNACPEKSACVNVEGYYSCDLQHEHADVNPHQLSTRKEGKNVDLTLGNTENASAELCGLLQKLPTYLQGKDFWSMQSPFSSHGRRCHINQLIAVSDWNEVYLFHSTWLLLQAVPQLSPLTCQTL